MHNRIILNRGLTTIILLACSLLIFGGVLYAAPIAMKFEAETATISGNVEVVADASASGSQALRYFAAAPPPPAPTVSLSSLPVSITAGATTTLTWSSANAATCTASGGWSDTKTLTGTETVTPTTTTSYTLSCTGSGGAATASTTVIVTSPPSSPSGQAMPVGDVVSGGQTWRQIFTDDFTKDVPLGSFPTAVADKWGGYGYPGRDTTGKAHGATDGTIGGWYHPGKTISIANGMMDMWLHTELIDGVKKRLAAAPAPLINGANATGPLGTNGQLYGRYAYRFRVDPTRIVNNFEGYKVAWLLWPKSGVWPRDGEIDFPEGNLNGTIDGFLHKQDATAGSDQYYAKSGKKFTDWHTAVIEWGPGRGAFYIDGALITGTSASGGKSEWFSRIPNTPMRMVLQSETALGSGFLRAPEISEGHIQIDWIAVYKKL